MCTQTSWGWLATTVGFLGTQSSVCLLVGGTRCACGTIQLTAALVVTSGTWRAGTTRANSRLLPKKQRQDDSPSSSWDLGKFARTAHRIIIDHATAIITSVSLNGAHQTSRAAGSDHRLPHEIQPQ